jgi:hypothetical protein
MTTKTELQPCPNTLCGCWDDGDKYPRNCDKYFWDSELHWVSECRGFKAWNTRLTDAIRKVVDLMDDHTMVVITNKAEFAYIQEHCSRYKLPPYLGERTEFPIAVSLNDGGGWTDRMDRALCYVTFTDAIAKLTAKDKRHE